MTVRTFKEASKSFATMHLFAITKEVAGFALMCVNKKRLNVGQCIVFHLIPPSYTYNDRDRRALLRSECGLWSIPPVC